MGVSLVCPREGCITLNRVRRVLRVSDRISQRIGIQIQCILLVMWHVFLVVSNGKALTSLKCDISELHGVMLVSRG